MSADIAVLGAGAWGAALAMAEAAAGRSVILWARRPERAVEIARTRSLAPYLPDAIRLPDSITVTSDLAEVAAAPIILAVTPAQALRGVLTELRPTGQLVLCCKGVELGTGALMPHVASEAAPEAQAFILSGPNFAAEVARQLPAAATLAGPDLASASQLADRLATPSFRLYPSGDRIGVALGGALKNVMAIAAGVVEGAGLGENARAGVATRGLAEMARIAVAMGAERETLMGLAGVGDLMLTCSGNQSRNYSLGVALGQGRALSDILAERQTVAEGVATAAAARALAERLEVEVPIIAAVDDVTADRLDLRTAIQGLLTRPLARDERT
ncbi:MAG: NAD(P)H-dependent glycerol-3-phosphate dehydrogenase [Alphaproteobacteria bacterium]|jgi:glycerol-3-phosphate dehydrogenase (NAD(P)+)